MSEVVKGYYDENAKLELERLNNPYSSIEFNSTMHLIDKYFPKTGEIIDIGSGPGRYSLELLKKRYKVTLLELSEKELEIAKQNIEELGIKAEGYLCENALNLNILESNKYDGVLLMGPMYHILDKEQRINVLKETLRILKKDGIAIISYLNSWGILKAGITEFSSTFRELENVYGYLDEQTFDENNSFTEAYFSTPVHALDEVRLGGFHIVSYAGVESFLSGIRDRVLNLYKEDRGVYDNLLKVAVESCELPQYRDSTEHLHIVVKKI
ncbi:class I SAM-dependent methyltransferase [Clostridium algidicarnis]|uniref:class I SAM-dependent methyltransferase n=1 Tax=Clostridium algidicarnis TaxID=37659 RepID=UPI001C0DEF26|nr:class I SAM-dependent methyltransferase [Clostridium algidicarnis]MBU3227636.1 class I SAM-dependent methyltransferase [Clostridium algidicarnis]MBU3250957.1 class I SAM-dependent methyltransferase [Clostridium algidicarnis]